MRKFVARTLFFLSPFLVLGISQGFLPNNFFTHRLHEAIIFKSSFKLHPFPLYENQKADITGTGDLCYNTKYEVVKDETYSTDQLGFRNNAFINNPDVLIIGDSFTMGAAMSQKELLANQIMDLSNHKYKIYAIAPSDFSTLDYLLKLKIIKPPKLIIYERVERGFIPKIEYYKNNYSDKIREFEYNILGWNNINVFFDKILRGYVFNYIHSKIINAKGVATQSQTDKNVFFHNTTDLRLKQTWIDNNVKSLISYKKYTDSLGSKLLYLPMPNKETVYFDKIPVKEQPDYLFEIGDVLKRNNIQYYQTLGLYNDFRKQHKELLYHNDDSHWTPLACKIVSKEILKIIEKEIQ